jgi:hypothetical protein
MIDIDTALQFAIETLLVELRRPETESVLEPVFDHYQVTPQERTMILRHIHTLAPFQKLFGHYRGSIETPEVRRAITAEAVTALRELQAQRYKLLKVTQRLDQATKPLPALPREGKPGDAVDPKSRTGG